MSSKQRISIGYGLLCIALGGLWLMHAMAILPWRLDDYIFSWRFLIVVIGALVLVKNPQSVFGILILAVGGISTITYYWDLPEGWENYLPPIALIFVGLILILRPNPDRPKFDTTDENVINKATVLGKYEGKFNSVLFKGGYISSFMGSNVIDFSSSHLGKEKVTIYSSNTMGNCLIIIPKGWHLSFNNKNILGSNVDKCDKTDSTVNKEGTLEIIGTNFLGKLTVMTM